MLLLYKSHKSLHFRQQTIWGSRAPMTRERQSDESGGKGDGAVELEM